MKPVVLILCVLVLALLPPICRFLKLAQIWCLRIVMVAIRSQLKMHLMTMEVFSLRE